MWCCVLTAHNFNTMMPRNDISQTTDGVIDGVDCYGYVPGREGRISDAREWVKKLNEWKQSQLKKTINEVVAALWDPPHHGTSGTTHLTIAPRYSRATSEDRTTAMITIR